MRGQAWVKPATTRARARGRAGATVALFLVLAVTLLPPAVAGARPTSSGPTSPSALPASASAAAPESAPAPSTSPSITIVQDSIAESAQDFTYTGCLGSGCGTFTLDDDRGAAGEDGTVSSRITGPGLSPGTYTISQSATAGWVLTDIACDTGEVIDLASRRVTITLLAGEAVTCTFTDRSPSITIVEDADPDAAQDFVFSGCAGVGCGSFALDDDADPALANGVSGSALSAGTYTVTQSPTANWSLTDLTCTPGETVDLAERRVTVTLGPVEHAVCTFTNRTQSLTIVENTAPDAPQSFGFTGCQGAACGAFALRDDGVDPSARSVTGAALASGTYTVTQDLVAGWRLTGLRCDTGETVDLSARRATVHLAVGDHVVCTFTDEAVPELSVETAVDGLSFPWDVAFTPDGSMLFTERGGSLSVVPPGAADPHRVTLIGNHDFLAIWDLGLLGMAVDPGFSQNRRFYTCQAHDDLDVPDDPIDIEVMAWQMDESYTTASRVNDPLVGGIPLGGHGGCQVEVGADGYLWISTGDAGTGTAPQDLRSLAGKVLRVDRFTGEGAPTNVFASDGDPATDARIHDYGHRNPQGLAPRGQQMWSVEHGTTRDDEINLLQNGGNYGWNPVPGYNDSAPMTDPAIPGAIPARWSSGFPTIATSGGTFVSGDAWQAYDGWLAVATLKGSSLRMMGITADGEIVYHDTPPELVRRFGRLRTPVLGPDGSLYVTTSNGVGVDRILRVTPR